MGRKNITQPEMLDIDADRHPMWEAPERDVAMPVINHNLLCRIAEVLVPFDGRPNNEFVVAYCKEVYAHGTCNINFKWSPMDQLIGRIVTTRVLMVKALEGMVRDCQPHTRHLYQNDIGVITRLCEDFVQAILKETA